MTSQDVSVAPVHQNRNSFKDSEQSIKLNLAEILFPPSG